MKEDILVKYIVGEAEEHEITMVNQWLAESDENKIQFQELKNIWDKSVALKDNKQVDLEKALDKVMQRTQGLTVKKFNWNTIYKVAASLILIASVSIALFYFSSNNNPIVLANNDSVNIKTISLSDSSKLTLKANTKLSYNNKFGIENRAILLEKGTVFFKVKKDQSMPFVITCDETTITVVGTEFEVKKTSDFVSVFVHEGKVKFSHSNQEIFISKGMKYQYDIKNKSIKSISNINETEMSYATGIFDFNQMSLKQVIGQLNEYYNCKIQIDPKNKSIENTTLTSKFQNNSLEEVIQILELTLDVKLLKISEKEYLITDKK